MHFIAIMFQSFVLNKYYSSNNNMQNSCLELILHTKSIEINYTIRQLRILCNSMLRLIKKRFLFHNEHHYITIILSHT